MQDLRKIFSITMVGFATLAVVGCGTSNSTNKANQTSNTSSKSTASSNGSNKASSSNGTVNITFAWWTNPVRTKLTKQVVALFEKKYPNIHVTVEPYPWSGYWSKLATQIAGGSEPDVMQMAVTQLKEYVQNGRLADLKKLGLNVDNMPSVAISEGTVNGKLYAIPNGFNTALVIYNPDIVRKAGVPFPSDSSDNYTWPQLSQWAIDIHKKSRIWGIDNAIGNDLWFQSYAKSKGDNLWASNGKSLAVTKNVVADWYSYWLTMQEKGGTPPVGVTDALMNSNSSVGQDPFVQGKTAALMTWLGEGQAYASDLNKPVKREPVPGLQNTNHPSFVNPSQYWAVSSTTKHPKAAAEFVDFLDNNAQAAKILGYNRGVTVNTAALKSVEKTANSVEKRQAQIISEVENNGSPLPIAPASASKVGSMFQTIGMEVLYKKKTPSQAAADFIKQADQYMKNN